MTHKDDKPYRPTCEELAPLIAPSQFAERSCLHLAHAHSLPDALLGEGMREVYAAAQAVRTMTVARLVPSVT